VFMRDPTPLMSEDKPAISLETTRPLGRSTPNVNWIQTHLGPDALEPVKDRPVLSSVAVAGQAGAVTQLTTEVAGALEASLERGGSIRSKSAQGVLNVVVWSAAGASAIGTGEPNMVYGDGIPARALRTDDGLTVNGHVPRLLVGTSVEGSPVATAIDALLERGLSRF